MVVILQRVSIVIQDLWNTVIDQCKQDMSVFEDDYRVKVQTCMEQEVLMAAHESEVTYHQTIIDSCLSLHVYL